MDSILIFLLGISGFKMMFIGTAIPVIVSYLSRNSLKSSK